MASPSYWGDGTTAHQDSDFKEIRKWGMNADFPEMPPRFDPANDPPDTYPDRIRMEFEGELEEAYIKKYSRSTTSADDQCPSVFLTLSAFIRVIDPILP